MPEDLGDNWRIEDESLAGLIHAFNERISGLQADRAVEMARWVRPTVALGLLSLGTFVSCFGLIDLIAKGYGTLTIGFVAVYVAPVLALGVMKMRAAWSGSA